jgi:hypothetical protein
VSNKTSNKENQEVLKHRESENLNPQKPDLIINPNTNPYKWIMEEFENKNLDKVRRTLLVTLDDISKGIGNN